MHSITAAAFVRNTIGPIQKGNFTMDNADITDKSWWTICRYTMIYPFDVISSLNELSAPPALHHSQTRRHCSCRQHNETLKLPMQIPVIFVHVHVTSWDGTGKCLKGSACNSYTGIHPCRLRHEPHRRAWSLSRSYCLGLGWPGGKPSIFQEWRGNGSFKLCLSWLLGQYAPVKFLGCDPGVSSWLSTFEKRYIMNIHSVSQCYTENRPNEWILADANGKAAHSLNLYCGPWKGRSSQKCCQVAFLSFSRLNIHYDFSCRLHVILVEPLWRKDLLVALRCNLAKRTLCSCPTDSWAIGYW